MQALKKYTPRWKMTTHMDRFCIVHEVQDDRHRSTDDDHPVFLLIKVLVHDPAADDGGQERSNEGNRCEIADCFQIDAAFCDEVGRHPGIEAFIDAGNTECAKDEFPDQGELQTERNQNRKQKL